MPFGRTTVFRRPPVAGQILEVEVVNTTFEIPSSIVHLPVSKFEVAVNVCYLLYNFYLLKFLE
jgi:hypothetical protein